jgi:hypothetical protein
MPPFLNTLRRFLPLPEEDQFRTPDFNPMSGRKPLPSAGRQLPTVMSDQPQLPAPRAPLPIGGGSLPTQLSSMPDPANQIYSRAPRLPRPSMGPLPTSDAQPSTALTRPTMQPMPDIPQLPNRQGPAVPDNPIDRARYDYVMRGAKRTPEGGFAGDKIQFKRSGKDIGLAALTGLQQGGLLGAITGALGGVIDPMGQRERNFDALQLPRLEAQRARQLQEEDRLRLQATQELAMRRGQLGLEQEQAQTDLYKAQAQRALNPAISREDPRRGVFNTPRGTLDLGTGRIIEGTEPLVREQRISPTQQLTEAETERAAQEGDVEQITEDSYQGRGGDQYVFSKLQPQIQEIITKGTIDGSPATPQEIEAAQRTYQQAIDRERKNITEYTKGQAKRKTAKRAVGKKSGPASATGTRSLRELESKYFGGK